MSGGSAKSTWLAKPFVVFLVVLLGEVGDDVGDVVRTISWISALAREVTRLQPDKSRHALERCLDGNFEATGARPTLIGDATLIRHND